MYAKGSDVRMASLGLRRFCVAGVGQCALPRGRMYALASLGAPPLLRGRRGTMCTAKGSDVRPGVPWGSASFAWQAWDNVHCQGVGCTPWRPLGLRRFCVAGVGQCALPRGRMYALASLGAPPLLRGRQGTMCTAKGSDVCPGVPWGSASFAWQAWDNVHCQGAPPLLRGKRGTMCTAKGSDVRPGVPWGSASFAWQAWDNVHCQGIGCTPWRPLGLRLSCEAGVGQCRQCAFPRGRMYALASLGAPPLLRGRRGTMCTAKGSDVPWRPLGLRVFCVAGVGQCALPRGRMYALASLRAPPLLRSRRGTMCTAKGSDVRPGVPSGSAAFAWQAWDNVHCQGVGCTPWRPLGLRLFCVAGVGQCALPRGRMYALAFFGAPPLCVAGVGQCALPRGRMYALASLGAPRLLRGRRGTMCTSKGSDVRPAPLLRGRRGTMCTAKGLDVRPGVPLGSASFAWQAWDNVHCQGSDVVAGVGHCALFGCMPRGRMYALASLGLRLFCVAGVGQCALPRGRMYALASLGAPPLLCVRRGTMCTAKGSDVRPGVPRGSASLRGRRGTMCTAKGLGAPPLLRGRRGSHSLTHSITHSFTHSLTHPLTHSLTLGTRRSTGWPCCSEARRNIWPLPRRNRWTRYSGWRWCHVVPTCQQTNSTSTCTRRVTGYLSARASTSVQSTTDDQVVPVHAFVQLLQAVIASSCCRTISGLTKVLVRPAMTLHTWSRIVMWCISSNRCLTSMEYFDLKALAISAYTDLKKIYI